MRLQAQSYPEKVQTLWSVPYPAQVERLLEDTYVNEATYTDEVTYVDDEVTCSMLNPILIYGDIQIGVSYLANQSSLYTAAQGLVLECSRRGLF